MTPRSDFPRESFDQLEMRLAPDEIIVDSFAGGGGASLGIQWALGRGPHIAINHDKEAIALHQANHPDSEHFPEDVWHVDPVEACAGRKVGLMWLSPDCKHFSKAKGAKPVSKKIRGLAWTACRWAGAVRPRVIVLENVEEFKDWGPLVQLDGKWRPDPAKKGHTFNRFVARLRRLGYVVEWRELRACDYGTPTIRKRLFLIARCDGRSIVWPAPTHGKGRAQPWRTAAECIDWSIVCPSIFERKKALADNTLRRIARGIKRYVIDSPKPFIVQYHAAKRTGDDRVASLDEPMRTQSTENRFGLVTPILAGVGGRAGQSPERSLEQPYQTITAKADAAIVAPFLKPRYGEDPDPTRRGGLGQAPRSRSIEEPMPVVVPTGNGADLVATFLAKHYGGHETPGASLADPASTITTQDHHHLVAAHLARFNGDRIGGEVDAPVGTVIASTAKHALVTSHLTNFYTSNTNGGEGDLSEPLRTVTSAGLHSAEVRAFLISYYGTDQASGSLTSPAPTVTPRDRFGLVTVEGVEYQIADIGMRMLAPRELYRAQGFPDSYRIDIEFNGKPMTKTAQVRMCGNSVCPPLAAAIIRANLLGETFANTERAA